MKIESEIVKELQNNIENLIPLKGLKFDIEPESSLGLFWRPDIVAHVRFKNWQFKIVGEVVAQSNSPSFQDRISRLKSHVAQNQKLVPMIVARYLSPKRIKQCREAGVYFLDVSGNVFLEYKGLYVERMGFPNRFPEIRRGRGPFSDKASLILRAMMSNKEKLWGIRELAKLLNLDPGFVSRIARELEKRKYVARLDSKLKLLEPRNVLEDWVHAYDYKKNRAIDFFHLGKGPDEIMNKICDIDAAESVEYALSLHAGANLVSPFAVFNEVHLYVSNKDSIDLFAESMHLKKVQQGANVIFLLPYYKHSVFHEKQRIRNLWVVSDIQLYLDLYNYPIRGLEQAENIYKKCLKDSFKQ